MISERTLRLLPVKVGYDTMSSPVGELTILASQAGLHAVLWDVAIEAFKRKNLPIAWNSVKDYPVIVQTQKQLSEYFEGKRKTFDLPLALQGTGFQMQVWQQLLKIPYGQTLSYGEQAQRLGDKNKSRAVGLANGCNPISIIVPCHRVIGSKGQLIGFAGGLDKKAYLLTLEQRYHSP